MIALPGIIDAHTCLWQTVLRGFVPDLWPGGYYSEFLPLRTRYTAEDNYHAAYVGGFEMLSYGTTTVVDYCHDIRAPGYADASIEALRSTGIRHLFTYSFMGVQADDFPGPTRATTTPAASTTRSMSPPASRPSASASTRSAHRAWRGSWRSRAVSRPRAASTSTRPAPSKSSARWACSGPDLLVIHGNLLSNAELERMAEARMPLCFTPTADTQGTPADVVRRAVERGVEVVFGCDIPCTVASDTLGQLRVMFNVQGFLDGAIERSFSTVLGRRPTPRPGLPLLAPRKLLEMATIGAARALGFDDRIGSLTPGKRADIVLIRKGPFGCSVVADPCAHVLLQTSPREIDTVLVDGEVRLRDGVLVGFDAKKAAAMIHASRQRLLA